MDLDEGSRVILTFAGDASFMLVEETVSKGDEMEVIPTSGDLDLFGNSIAIVGESSVSFMNDGVEYYLVSSEMSSDELLSVAKSISVMPVSK